MIKEPPFRAIATANALLLIAVIGSATLPMFKRMGEWNQAQKLEALQDASARLTIADIERQREIADAAAENGILKTESVQIYDYTANPADPPSYEWLQSVDPAVPTLVYDRYRACVGLAHEGKLVTIFEDPSICNRRTTP